MPRKITITPKIARAMIRRGEKIPSVLAFHCRFSTGLLPPGTSGSFIDRASDYCESNGLTEACDGLCENVTDADARAAAVALMGWEYIHHRAAQKQAKAAFAVKVYNWIRTLFRTFSSRL